MALNHGICPNLIGMIITSLEGVYVPKYMHMICVCVASSGFGDA